MVKEFKDTTQNKSIAFILGTRPEIIKLSPVIRACIRRNTFHRGKTGTKATEAS